MKKMLGRAVRSPARRCTRSPSRCKTFPAGIGGWSLVEQPTTGGWIYHEKW
jgi:hypothetical protein